MTGLLGLPLPLTLAFPGGRAVLDREPVIIDDPKVEGTGLAVALSRKFVELHGGRIWVKSDVGVSSTLTLHLPLGNAQRR